MFYYIFGIVIGILLLGRSLLTFKRNKNSFFMDFVTGILFLIVSVGGFFVPKSLEFIPMLFLLVLAIVYLLIALIKNPRINPVKVKKSLANRKSR